MPNYLLIIICCVLFLGSSKEAAAQSFDLNILPSVTQILTNDDSEKEKFNYGTCFSVGMDDIKLFKQYVRFEVGIHYLNGNIKTRRASPGGTYRFNGQMQNTGVSANFYPVMIKAKERFNVNLGVMYSINYMKEDGIVYSNSVIDPAGYTEKVMRSYKKNVWSPVLQCMYRPGAENGNFNVQYSLSFNQLGSKRILLHSLGFGLTIN